MENHCHCAALLANIYVGHLYIQQPGSGWEFSDASPQFHHFFNESICCVAEHITFPIIISPSPYEMPL
jgi:hypothetical protein